jgi:hypothetical protein
MSQPPYRTMGQQFGRRSWAEPWKIKPVSLANVKGLRALCDRYGIRIYLDATRLVENAFFIQARFEPLW